MKTYEFYVAGVKFHQLKTCINEVEEGDILTLTQEPTNKFDPNAVRIKRMKDGKATMLGYVPAKLSAQVTASMEIKEMRCRVLQIIPSAKPWEQLEVSIEEATEDA